MKIKLTAIFCILLFSGNAQTSFTNGSVYDYNVGDIFQTYTYGTGLSSLLPKYVTKEVLTKGYSGSFDTIFYSFKRTVYNPPLCGPPCTGSTSVDTIFEYYTNLSSIVDILPLDILLSDSIGLEYCGKDTWRYTSRSFPNLAGEFNQSEHYFVQGCGGLYFNRIIGIFGPASEHYNLVYYKKAGFECGSLITGLNEVAIKSLIFVYPNPSNGNFVITSKGNLVIYNSVGNFVLSRELEYDKTVIDISFVSNGIYSIVLQTETGVFTGKIVKQ